MSETSRVKFEICSKMETSAIVSLSSNTFLVAITCVLITVLVYFVTKRKKSSKNKLLNNLKPLPGPSPFPIIGNLASLSGTEYPCQAFDGLFNKYGPIVGVQLGAVKVKKILDAYWCYV